MGEIPRHSHVVRPGGSGCGLAAPLGIVTTNPEYRETDYLDI